MSTITLKRGAWTYRVLNYLDRVGPTEGRNVTRDLSAVHQADLPKERPDSPIYAALVNLNCQGLLESDGGSTAGRSRVFAITEKGRERLAALRPEFGVP